MLRAEPQPLPATRTVRTKRALRGSGPAPAFSCRKITHSSHATRGPTYLDHAGFGDFAIALAGATPGRGGSANSGMVSISRGW
jgi:hypothetical protein